MLSTFSGDEMSATLDWATDAEIAQWHRADGLAELERTWTTRRVLLASAIVQDEFGARCSHCAASNSSYRPVTHWPRCDVVIALAGTPAGACLKVRRGRGSGGDGP